jgi:argininosuccinate synthase
MASKVVLAYSGGLDTSAIVPWLIEHGDYEVHAFVGDVGQGDAELHGIEEKALTSGAASCHVADLKAEFVADYIYPSLIAGVTYEKKYLLGTAMARPVIAKAQVDFAKAIGADAVAHGCTGKGNDQVRFEAAYAALAPDLHVIAPWRTWHFESREDLLEYIASKGVPCDAGPTKIYSRDRNLWHVSHEGGSIEDPWSPPPGDAWQMTAPLDMTPDTPQEVHLVFKNGHATSLDSDALAPHDLLAKLNLIAGEHGVGRVDIIENRLVGMKSRGLYETPGGTVLVEALQALAELVLDRDTAHALQQLGLTYADLLYDGKWFTPLRSAINAFAADIAPKLTGEVVVKLYKGHATATKRQSPFSLYSEAFATFGADDVYDQKHAEGFIRLHALPQRIAAIKGLSNWSASTHPADLSLNSTQASLGVAS